MVGISFVLAGLLTATAGNADTPTDLEARWRRDYPRAAEEWEAVARGFTAQGSYTFRIFKGDTLKTKALTVLSSGDKRLYVRDQQSIESPRTPTRARSSHVRCQTAEYAFDLEKTPTSSTYLILNHGDPDKNDESEFEYHWDRFARNATVFYGTSLMDRMRDPTFVLKSIAAARRGDDELVRIEYAYAGKYVFESGVVELDPAKNWALRSAAFDSKNKKTANANFAIKIEVEYAEVVGTRYFPKRMEYFCRTSNPEMFEHEIVDFNEITLGTVPDASFRLTAFGLPDLPSRPTRRASVFTLRNPLLWLALGSTAVSLFLWRLIRHREARTV